MVISSEVLELHSSVAGCHTCKRGHGGGLALTPPSDAGGAAHTLHHPSPLRASIPHRSPHIPSLQARRCRTHTHSSLPAASTHLTSRHCRPEVPHTHTAPRSQRPPLTARPVTAGLLS